MLIKAGFDIEFGAEAAAPMVALLSIRPECEPHLRSPQRIVSSPSLPTEVFMDAFGNVATRLIVPAGGVALTAEFLIADSGEGDRRAPDAPAAQVNDLPADVLQFLLGSRYCETQLLMQFAWAQFGGLASARDRVEAVVDFVHNHISFGYQHARATRTAWNGFEERVGVCRDFAHLAITLCRCVNIPSRYCTGYLGDIGVPLVDAPMDFSAWFEVFVDGAWYAYDARHQVPRIGRVPMARGRDAADCALTTTFGATCLRKFEVQTYEVPEGASATDGSLLLAA